MNIVGGLSDTPLNPVGWEDFGLVREFEVQGQRLTVTNGSLKLANEDRELLFNWYYNQFGRFINYPITVTSSNGFNQRYFLDLKTGKFSDSDFEADLVVRQGNDNFFDRSKGLTFEEIYKKGFLPDSLFVDCPFQVVQQYTTLEKIVLLATLLSLSQTLINITKEAIYLVNEAANPTNVAALILKAITFAIWLTATIVLLITILQQIKALVYPKVRNFKMCSDYDLIKAGCDYLGFTLSSTYLFALKDSYFTLPVPKAKVNKSIFDFTQDELTNVFHNQGYPTSLDGSIATHFGLIDDWLRLHNLEIFVKDGVVQIEQPTFFDSTPLLTIPVAFSDQENSEKVWTYNNELRDVWRRKYLTYAVDYVDSHSPDIDGSVRTEYITEPITIPTGCNDLVGHEGFYEVQGAHALLKRKNKLLPAEKLLFEIASKVNQITAIFGGGSNLASGILDRQGIGMIGSQWFSVPKRVYANRQNGKQPFNYLSVLSMDNLYVNNHAQYDVINQNARRFASTIPLSPNDFDILQVNNRVFLETGELAKVMSCKYTESESQRTAEMILQIADGSAFNTKTTKLA